MKLLTNKVIFFGFIINLVIVLILGWTAIERSTYKNELLKLSEHREEVLLKLRNIRFLINDLQNEAKGYALTNNEQFLSRVRKSGFETEKELEDLKILLAGDTFQVQYLNLLERVVDQKTNIHEQLIEEVRYKGLEPARKEFVLRENPSINENIDRISTSIQNREEFVYAMEKKTAESGDRILQVIFSICFWIVFVMLGIILVIFRAYSKEKRQSEILLINSEQLLRSIMDNSPNLVYVKDVNGEYLLANKTFTAHFGDAKGKTDSEIFTKQDAGKKRETDLEVVKTEQAEQVNEIFSIDGVDRTFLTTKFPIRDLNGRVNAIGGISVDISDQARQNTLIKGQADEIEKIFNGAPDGIIVIDEESKILRWNLKAEELFKWKAEEVLGKPMYEIIMPERFRSRHINGVKHFIQTGQGPILNKTVEVRAINRDNVEFDVELTISASRPDKYMFISFIRDVTERKKMERDIQQTKNFLDSVLDHVPDMLVIKDTKEFRIVRANKAAEAILGRSRTDLSGKHYSELFSKELADEAAVTDRQALETRSLLEIPEELVETPGGKRWLNTKKIVILDDKDQPAYLLCVSEDISSKKILADERNNAYKMLQESEEKMSLMLRNIGDAVVATDDKMNITFMNSVGEKLSGWREQEVKGKQIEEVFKMVGETSRQPVANPAVEAVKQKKVISLEKDTILVRKDNSEIFIDDSGSPIMNAKGEVIGSVLIFRDVTEDKNAQQQIRDAAKRFTQIFNLSPVAICISEADSGKFLYVNDAFCDLVKFTSEELIGKTSIELKILQAEQRKELVEEMQKAGGHARDIETILRGSDGNIIQVLYSVEPIQMDGLQCLAISLVDITERKNAEMRIAMLMENIDEGVILANAEQKILLTNRHADEILGIQEDYYSSDWTKRYDIFYPDGKTLFPAQNLPIERALRGEEIHDLEILLRDRQTREAKLLRVSGQPVFTQDNRLLAAVATLKDITQQRETERVLEETKMKYRKLIGFGRDKGEDGDGVDEEKDEEKNSPEEK
jgi:PAS domain S-box-containing protein